ncbi:PseG/SpsG family protein [Roseivirga sp.]|uniref:PseG/SpsG family protein n=1 Tax=Roseivirga sp. TaxID=1964215 RepID=UPI003B52BE51
MSFPKVLFRVDANPQIGWGHFYRSLSLALMLRDEFHIVFAMGGTDSATRSELDKLGIDLLEVEPQEYSTPDKRGSKELEFDLHNVLNEVDIVVLDGYWFGINYQLSLKQKPVKVAMIIDELQGVYCADLIINHAPGAHKSSLQVDKDGVIFLLGTNYALLRPSFLAQARKDIRNDKEIKRVLVSFGGSDNQNFSFSVSNWLLHSTNCLIHVVLGPGYSDQKFIRELKDRFPERLIIHSNLNEHQMLEQMVKADVGILPSSGVLMEAVACRLPSISGSYIDNQDRILQGFHSAGAIVKTTSFYDLENSWQDILKKGLSSIRDQHKMLIDGESGERLVKAFKCLS